jgi:hypothetical protein
MGMSDINTVDPTSHPGRFPSREKAAGAQRQRLCRPQSQSRLFGEKINISPLLGIETRYAVWKW